jgi:hypothetical protein
MTWTRLLVGEAMDEVIIDGLEGATDKAMLPAISIQQRSINNLLASRLKRVRPLQLRLPSCPPPPPLRLPVTSSTKEAQSSLGHRLPHYRSFAHLSRPVISAFASTSTIYPLHCVRLRPASLAHLRRLRRRPDIRVRGNLT